MKSILISFVKLLFRFLPQGMPEFIYTTILKPKPLKITANRIVTSFLPDTLRVGNSLVALNKKDAVVSGALVLGVYEKFETELIRENIKPGVFIDIGANIGYYTAIAADAVGAEGLVLAFEPEPENFKFLRKTVALNNFKNVECYEMGIADFTGTGKLYLSPEGNQGDHRIYLSPEKKPCIEIKLTTLDDFLKIRGIEKVDMIKIDIQGAEGLAIQGMKKMLEQNKSIKLFTEFWPLGIERTGLQPADYLRSISDHGFKIFNINRKNGHLEQVTDIDLFAKKFKGREFANLFCER